MPDQEIFIIGNDEICEMFSLLGIDGKIIEKSDEFLPEFQNLIKKPSIGMIIIAITLPDNIVDFLIDFKLNTRRPFIFHLPNMFEPNIEREDIFFKKIFESISQIIS